MDTYVIEMPIAFDSQTIEYQMIIMCSDLPGVFWEITENPADDWPTVKISATNAESACVIACRIARDELEVVAELIAAIEVVTGRESA